MLLSKSGNQARDFEFELLNLNFCKKKSGCQKCVPEGNIFDVIVHFCRVLFFMLSDFLLYSGGFSSRFVPLEKNSIQFLRLSFGILLGFLPPWCFSTITGLVF